MGSFNGRCAISGLPIVYQDEVKLLLIRPKVKYDTLDTEHWEFISYPVDGTYNDYGSIDFFEDAEDAQLLQSYINHHLIERGIGDNTAHDIAVRYDSTLKEYLDAAWEKRLRLFDSHSYKTREKLGAQPDVVTKVDKLLGKDYIVSDLDGQVRIRANGYHSEKEGLLTKAVSLLADHDLTGVTCPDTGLYRDGNQILINDSSCERSSNPKSYNVQYVMILKSVWDMMVGQDTHIPAIVQNAFQRVIDAYVPGYMIDDGEDTSPYENMFDEGNVRLFNYEVVGSSMKRIDNIVDLNHPKLKRKKEAHKYVRSYLYVLYLTNTTYSRNSMACFDVVSMSYWALNHRPINLAQMMYEVSMVMARMDTLRLTVSPEPMCGQDSQIAEYVKFHRAVAKIASGIQKRYDEEDWG